MLILGLLVTTEKFDSCETSAFIYFLMKHTATEKRPSFLLGLELEEKKSSALKTAFMYQFLSTGIISAARTSLHK